ncbi:MAG: sulfite exporter TauE/SafE family protein [Verrucomicrobia bacterium]|nr:sulfite exporter TauE/SafE family protein [Verrucomicrobiota bacterium]MCH8527497.1 sulfite exporter TauE/SafE family protein [Kiritimatiellia bacterium]
MTPLLAGNGITLFTGFAKTGVPGVGILAAVLLANAVPDSRQSVGILLPLLIFADFFAVGTYRKHTQWKVIVKLLPPTLIGVLIGGVALDRLQNVRFDWVMGGLVLFQLFLDVLRQRLRLEHIPHHMAYAWFFGVLGGVTTTLGNMAGPVMTLYMLSIGLDKHKFMGSMAWFFLIINGVKVPIFVWQGMITAESLQTSLSFAPGVVIGALLGRRIFRHIPQGPFKRIVQVLAALAAFRLLGWTEFLFG